MSHTKPMAAAMLLLCIAACVSASDHAAYLERVQRFLLTQEIGAMTGSNLNHSAKPVDYSPTDLTWVKSVVGVMPEQIHLTPWTQTSMLVSWSTNEPTVGTSVSPPNPYSVDSVVLYGTSKNLTSKASMAIGTANNVVYTQNYDNHTLGDLSYSSGILHHVLLENLMPGTTYYYSVGDPNQLAMSPTYSFKQPPNTFPFRLTTFADAGTTPNASTTFQRIAAIKPDMALFVGDLSYADHYDSRGLLLGDNEPDRTYQPRWDELGRMLQQFTTSVPLLTVGGNHELEEQVAGVGQEIINAAYNARFPQPQNPLFINTRPNSGYSTYALRAADTTVNNVYWIHKVDGIMAVIGLSSYFPYEQGTKQYTWFTETIASLNRTTYPWLVVNFHTPMYLTYSGNFKNNECMRQIYEPWFHQYAVDFVFSGHTHSYERTYPIYNWERDECGTVYFLIGNAGVKITDTVIDQTPQPDWCANGTAAQQAWLANQDPQIYYPNGTWCFSYQNGSFCPPPGQQASWSAYRETSLGSGLLTLESPTNATWALYRNQDAPNIPYDVVHYTRNPQCLNKNTPSASPSGTGAGRRMAF